nr:hypothetical protein [Tanacetum cinerariifolium]
PVRPPVLSLADLESQISALKRVAWVGPVVFTLLGIRVFRELLKLHIRGVNGSTSSHDQGTARSSSPVGFRLFDFDFQCSPSLVSLSDTRDNSDSLSLPLFMLRERSMHESDIYVWPLSCRRSRYYHMILDFAKEVSASRTISARRRVPFAGTTSTMRTIPRVCLVRAGLSCAWRVESRKLNLSAALASFGVFSLFATFVTVVTMGSC